MKYTQHVVTDTQRTLRSINCEKTGYQLSAHVSQRRKLTTPIRVHLLKQSLTLFSLARRFTGMLILHF